MPIKLSDLKRKLKEVTVELADGDKIVCRVRVNYWTPAMADRFGNDQSLRGQALVLAQAIESWDITDDDGKPVPVYHEALGPDGMDRVPSQELLALGMPILMAIGDAILEATLPNPRNSGTSAGQSSPEAG